MLDIKRIREDKDTIKEPLLNKGADISLIDKAIEIDEKRRS